MKQQQENDKGKVKGVADIVFCIDVTASMQPCIDGVKKNVEKFIENLKTDGQQNKIDWRAKVIGYRDCFDEDKDKYKPFEGLDNPMVSDAEELKKQIEPLEASGGGDEPESTMDAIYKAVKDESNWRPAGEAHRFVIVFTDATSLENMHESTVEPGAPTDVNALANLIYMEKIKLYIFGPDCDIYDSLEKIPHSMHYEYTVDTLQKANFDKILESLAKTVSKASNGAPIKGPSQAAK